MIHHHSPSSSRVSLTVGDIRGRVIVEGGNSFESDGDTVIFHNSGGSNLSGLVTNREIPRMESLAGGVYQQALG